MTYLKNVILQYMSTGEHDKLFPVIAQMMQFSPQEVWNVTSNSNIRMSVQTTLLLRTFAILGDADKEKTGDVQQLIWGMDLVPECFKSF